MMKLRLSVFIGIIRFEFYLILGGLLHNFELCPSVYFAPFLKIIDIMKFSFFRKRGLHQIFAVGKRKSRKPRTHQRFSCWRMFFAYMIRLAAIYVGFFR